MKPHPTPADMLSVADRWADLAVTLWSAQWNYGRGRDRLLLDTTESARPRTDPYYRAVGPQFMS